MTGTIRKSSLGGYFAMTPYPLVRRESITKYHALNFKKYEKPRIQRLFKRLRALSANFYAMSTTHTHKNVYFSFWKIQIVALEKRYIQTHLYIFEHIFAHLCTFLHICTHLYLHNIQYKALQYVQKINKKATREEVHLVSLKSTKIESNTCSRTHVPHTATS